MSCAENETPAEKDQVDFVGLHREITRMSDVIKKTCSSLNEYSLAFSKTGAHIVAGDLVTMRNDLREAMQRLEAIENAYIRARIDQLDRRCDEINALMKSLG